MPTDALIECPGGCGLWLPEDDGTAQGEHMRAAHPEIVVQRLREAGMHQEADALEREGGVREYRLVREFQGQRSGIIGSDHVLLGECTAEQAHERARRDANADKVSVESRAVGPWEFVSSIHHGQGGHA